MKKKILSACTLLIALCPSIFAQNPNFQYSLSNANALLDYSGPSAVALKDSGYALLYDKFDSAANYSYNTYIQFLGNHGQVTGNSAALGDTSNSTGYAMLQTSDNGFIVAGFEYSTTSYSRYAFLLKTNSSGVQQWFQNYGKATNLTVGNAIAMTKSGGYIIAGSTQTITSFVNQINASQIFVARTDSKGDTTWTRTYGDSSLQGFANSIQTTTDGGFIITGSQVNGSEPDAYVLKIDSLGNKQWDKYYGGPYSSIGNDGMQTRDGSYLFAGSKALAGDTTYELYVVKTDNTGDTSWTFTDTNIISEAYGAIEAKGGEFVVSGFNSVGVSDSIPQAETDAYLVKISSSGKKIWSSNPFISQNIYYSGFNGIVQTADNGLLMPGTGNAYVNDTGTYPYGAALLVKTDSNGIISSVSMGISQISSRSNPNITVYPNPFSTQTIMDVSNTNLQDAVLLIFDLDGNLVKRIDNINSGTISIDRVNLTSGMYFYRLVNINGIIGTGKLMAE